MADIQEADIIVIGAGAAGFMAAITAKEHAAECRVLLLEATSKTLAKVRISGGGRCNVTNAQLAGVHHRQELVKYYPRGFKELPKVFGKFGQADTISFFRREGVTLKTEPDHRMFPITDSAETIASTLERKAFRLGVELFLSCRVAEVLPDEEGWDVIIVGKPLFRCKKLIIATGGGPKISHWEWLSDLGLAIVAPVPSLFTFNFPTAKELKTLMGTSFQEVEVTLQKARKSYCDAMVITHWGISGPAVLKLSAFWAFELAELGYRTPVTLNYLPSLKNAQEIKSFLREWQLGNAKRLLANADRFGLTDRFYQYLLQRAGLAPQKKVGELSGGELQQLATVLTADTYQMDGKTTYKEEFVTAGGVNISEVDFATMQSKRLANLYFAGEVLNIDGITGGFNFQAAWSTGYVAGKAAAEGLG